MPASRAIPLNYWWTRPAVMLLALSCAVAVKGLPHLAQGASCEAIVGQWLGFTNGVMTVTPDRTMGHEPGNGGTWTCADAVQGKIAHA